MRGVGIKADITTSRPYPVLLDITRLVSRVGLGPLTGVDRVEYAYLDWCLSTPQPLHCLAKVAGGYVLLDRSGAQSFVDKLDGRTAWGRRDARALIGIKTAQPRGAAESDLRRLAVATGKSMPKLPDAMYLNVGHSNLTETTMSGVVAQGLKMAVLVHDTIPLDWPDFQRDGSVAKFETKLRLVGQHANLIIANSNDTDVRVKHHLSRWGNSVPSVSAHLGVPRAETTKTKNGNRPYFITVGTIEPRKNHALLLDVWADIAADDRPDLHIVGRRGWRNDGVFRRLDALGDAEWFHEHSGMDDVNLISLLSGAHGLLFPSFAEGFGLPSLEAAQLGIPIICGDLAIHRELLGRYPVYADLQDGYRWKKIILEQAAQGQKDLVRTHLAKQPHIPTWSEHFATVNAAVMKLV